jgi:uncharacterized damage-inducible protein DinB
MANALTPLFEHNLWANLTLLDACRPLEPSKLELTIAGVYGTPASTFVHYISGEQRYVFRLSGEEPALPLKSGDPWPGFDDLIARAHWSAERLLRLAESTGPNTVTHQFFDGVDHEVTADVILVQAINHSTEHRAHIVTTLSAHGTALPEIDGWSWGEATGRQRRAAP